jgi:hypothetical protein
MIRAALPAVLIVAAATLSAAAGELVREDLRIHGNDKLVPPATRPLGGGGNITVIGQSRCVTLTAV